MTTSSRLELLATLLLFSAGFVLGAWVTAGCNT